MTPQEPARARSASCRADLLRLLAVAERDTLMLDVDASGWFGYVRQPEPEAQSRIIAQGAVTLGSVTAAPAPARKRPLRLASVHAVVEYEKYRPREPGAAAQEGYPDAAPLDEGAARATSSIRIRYEDLIPRARLLPALRRLLGANRRGPLDLDRLTQQLAGGQLPRHLPRRVLHRWHPDLVVLLDFCPRLWPYRWDMHRLAEQLLRHVGRSGVSLRIVNHGPYGRWSDWLAHQSRASTEDSEPAERPWLMPQAGTPVLIVSDLGMLFGPGSPTARAWVRFIDDLRRAQVRPFALVPLGIGQLGEPLPPSLPILRWSPDARLHPIRARGEASPKPEGLADLLAMVAATRRVDPPLLRAMRALNPRAPLNAGLEGALWCDDDVEAAHTASIRKEARCRHLSYFAEHLRSLHAELDRQRREHHAHLRAALNHEETLLWAAYVGEEVADRSPPAAERIKAAREFVWRLIRTLSQPGGETSANWWSVAQGIVERADTDARMWQRHADELHQLAVPLLRAQGAAAKIPEHADLARLRDLMGASEPALPCWLVRDSGSGSLRLQAEAAGTRQTPLGKGLTIDAGGVRVRVAANGSAGWLKTNTLPMNVGPIGEPAQFRLETANESARIAPVRRPPGAFEWGCDRNGLFVRSALFGAWEKRWTEDELRAVPPPEGQAAVPWVLEADAAPHPDGRGSLSFGIERRFGVYAELNIGTNNGGATQRLRWIEPGTFLMGSPSTDPGRFDNEGPRHEVTISRGYWLFDTPCTQALWQAVMGEESPSYFKSPKRPVENVSWDDVQVFLKRVNALVPGLALRLPSEAQWEYACRAGSERATYAGDIAILGENNAPALDPIAWYGGNSGVDFDLNNGWDSSKWPGKQYPHTRAGTRAVGLKDPNAWGLYDMLGNVWEWCDDGMRSFTAEAVTDPVGLMGAGGGRVLRGGSWNGSARLVRSACRYADGPGDRNDGFGFRCARVQDGREPAGGPEARRKKSRRGRSRPPEAAA